MNPAIRESPPPSSRRTVEEEPSPEISPRELGLPELRVQESLIECRPEGRIDDRKLRQAEQLRLLWERRRLLLRATVVGIAASALLAFLIPRSYTSTAQLMPPDNQASSSLAMMATMAAKGAGGLGSLASDLLGINTTGALFVGVLRSDTAQSRLVGQFELQKVYGDRLEEDARADLDESTAISEDRKSGIISISVTDHSPQRAAELAQAYVDQLNSLIAELSTSSAHRERVFLEERLKVAKRDLDDASKQLAQFSSQNSSVDVQTMGKAALEAAGRVAGELIATESQLEGLRQIYSDRNPRVRSLEGRVAELKKQLEQLDGSDAASRLLDPTHSSGGAAAAIDGPSNDTPANNIQANDVTANAMPYPSLHNLPLLGVKYADYYRRAKMQETIYELLTEQYELTKIREVKETPTVKVLDRARVAQKKSFPPRLLIVFLGAFLTSGSCVAWILAANRWQKFDPQDPRQVLALEIAAAVKARARRGSQNRRNSAGGGKSGIFSQASSDGLAIEREGEDFAE